MEKCTILGDMISMIICISRAGCGVPKAPLEQAHPLGWRPGKKRRGEGRGGKPADPLAAPSQRRPPTANPNRRHHQPAACRRFVIFPRACLTQTSIFSCALGTANPSATCIPTLQQHSISPFSGHGFRRVAPQMSLHPFVDPSIIIDIHRMTPTHTSFNMALVAHPTQQT